MRQPKYLLLLICLAAVFLLAFTIRLAPQALSLSWWTVDGGGRSDCYEYTSQMGLCGTAGQPDPNFHSNNPLTLTGGFWAGSRAVHQRVMLPLIFRH